MSVSRNRLLNNISLNNFEASNKSPPSVFRLEIVYPRPVSKLSISCKFYTEQFREMTVLEIAGVFFNVFVENFIHNQRFSQLLVTR